MKKNITKNQMGITLVALVVTIVVLLILAGVTIMYVMGDNSIFQKAQDAKSNTEQAKQDEQNYFGSVDNTINKYANGNGGTTNPPVKLKNISEIVGIKQESTVTVEDSNKNKITIPAGFKIVPDLGEKLADSTETDAVWNAKRVIYSYLGDEAKTPTVQDGIVIEDEKGNQFVWVPVGTINNKSGDTTHGATSTITLGRYENFTVKTDAKGNKYYQPKQTVEQYKKPEASKLTDLEYQDTYKIGNYMELTEQLEGKNTIAESLGSFLESATAEGGYYLARYEASNNSNKPISKANQTVWNNVTQVDAATYAKSMYSSTTDSVKSDLVNSYAWDTAIIFIQTYSKDNSDYAHQIRKKSRSSPFATGMSEDCVCNIHDMASNCVEWSTEYSSYNDGAYNYPCIHRGGTYYADNHVTADRRGDCLPGGIGYPYESFRPICYVK